MNFEAIFYDFDGVMTDNTVQISQDGSEFVRVNRGDGLAISEIKKLKIYQAIISTEKNPVVKARSEKLQIPCFQGVLNKLHEVNNICEAKKINLKNSAFIGNSASLGFNCSEEIEAYGHYINDVHIKDRRYKSDSVFLGDGDADFHMVFEKLSKIGYKGPFIMQAYRDMEGKNVFKSQLDWILPILQTYFVLA